MAIPPVVVEFLAKGIPDVQRAFKGIQQTFEQSERNQTRSADTGARARLRAASTEARAKEKEFAKVAREAERWQRQMVRASQQASKQEVKATEQAEREKTRAVERWTRTREQIQNRSALMAGREAVRAAREEARELERIAKDSANRRKAFMNTVGGAAVKAGRTIAGGIQRVGGTLLQVGGGYSLADSIKEQADLERSAMKLSNSAYQGTGQRMDTKKLQNAAKAASIATGTDAGELLKGAHAFGAKTGKYGEGVEQMKFFGEIAKGTDAKIEDVANAAGTLRIQNSDLTPEKMKGLLLQVVRQGQKGSIEFGDLATSVGKITRTSSGYVGDQAKTQGELLGIAQLGMKTMSDPRDVATSLAGVESDTKKHWKNIDAAMPGTFDNVGRIKKGPSEYIADIMGKTGGDTRKLQALGFGKQAMKYFQAMAPTFQKAGGGQAGRDAVLKEMKDSSEQAMPYEELQQNVANILKTSAEQFEGAVRQLKNAVGEQLLPEFAKMVPILVQLLPHLTRFLQGVVKIADWALDNPLKGLGAAIMALITKEIVAAQIADTIKRLIGGGPAPTPGGAGGNGVVAIGSGMIGQAVATAGLTTDTVGSGVSGQFKGEDLAAMAKSSDPAKRAEAQAAIAKARKTGNGLDTAAGYVDRAVTIGGAVLNPVAAMGSYFGDKAVDAAGIKSRSTRSNEAIEASQTVSKFDELTTATGKLASAMNAAAGAVTTPNPGSPSTSVENRTQTIAARTGK